MTTRVAFSPPPPSPLPPLFCVVPKAWGKAASSGGSWSNESALRVDGIVFQAVLFLFFFRRGREICTFSPFPSPLPPLPFPRCFLFFPGEEAIQAGSPPGERTTSIALGEQAAPSGVVGSPSPLSLPPSFFFFPPLFRPSLGPTMFGGIALSVLPPARAIGERGCFAASGRALPPPPPPFFFPPPFY